MSKFSDATFYLSPSGYKEGFIFPQKPISSNGDVTFTRASSAWRTNLEGQIEESPYNLLSYSEDFSNAIWGSGTGGTGVSPVKSYNTVIAPNGTLTADTIVFNRGVGNTLSDLSVIQQSFTDTALTTYTFSIWVKASTVSDVGKQIFLRIGASGALPPTTLTSDWVRISTTQTNTTAVSAFVQFGNRGTVTSGNSVSVDVWGAQIVRGSLPKNYLYTTNRQNFPRIDYSLGTGNLLLEPQRTNLLLNSIWANSGALPTSWTAGFSTGTLAPVSSIKNAGVSAFRFVCSTQRSEFYQIYTITSGTVLCFSAYVENAAIPVAVNQVLRVGQITGAGTFVFFKNGIVIADSTLVEAGFTYTKQLTCTSTGDFQFRIGAGVSSIITADITLSMPQYEVGAFSTTFIPTTTGSATRLVDSFSRNNLYTNGLLSASGGTWFIHLVNNIPYTRQVYSDALVLRDNAFSNTFVFTFGTSPGTSLVTIRKVVSGVLTALYLTTTPIVKMAIKWNGTTADIFTNGVKVVTATAFTATQLEILSGSGTDTTKSIQQTALWNTPLTDTQCIELTS